MQKFEVSVTAILCIYKYVMKKLARWKFLKLYYFLNFLKLCYSYTTSQIIQAYTGNPVCSRLQEHQPQETGTPLREIPISVSTHLSTFLDTDTLNMSWSALSIQGLRGGNQS